MIPILLLILSASQAIAKAPEYSVVASPLNITAGENTQVQFTVKSSFDCDTGFKPYARVKLGLMTQGALISHVYGDQSSKTKFENQVTDDDLFNGHDVRFLTFALPTENPKDFTEYFNYYDLNQGTKEKISDRLEINLGCSNNDGIDLDDAIENYKFLGTNVTAPPALKDIVSLTPSEANSTQVSTITLTAPWPTKCKYQNYPKIKIFLNEATAKADGALFSNSNSNVTGSKGSSTKVIVPKSNLTIETEKFDSLTFTKGSYALSNTVNLEFEFLGHKVPSNHIEDAPINVEFICNDTVVKNYTGKDAPIIKVNGASSASLAFSVFIFGTILSFL